MKISMSARAGVLPIGSDTPRHQRGAVNRNRQRHHAKPHHQHLIDRPAESLVESVVRHLRRFDLRPLARRRLRGHVDHHRNHPLDLIDLALDRGVDHAAVDRQQRAEIERKALIDLARRRLEAGGQVGRGVTSRTYARPRIAETTVDCPLLTIR